MNQSIIKAFDSFTKRISEKYNIPHEELWNLLWQQDSRSSYYDTQHHLHLGLCCINTILRQSKPAIFTSRSCTRKTFSVAKVTELSLQNVRDLVPMIEWNQQHGIRCFRLSSCMFPHFTDPETESFTIDFAIPDLQKAGALAKSYGHRILMHPGQFNQVGAISPTVFQKTIEELSHHASILEAMGIDHNGVLIVHGGGMYGDKTKTMERWIDNYFRLPECVQKRLVIENCEKCYNLEDVLYISQQVSARGGTLPVVFDNHHYICYNKLHPSETVRPITDLIPEVLKTWGDRRPVMHISEQGSGRCGHHSDYITEIPEYFLEIPQKYKVSFDLEVEAKAKEQAIFRLYSKYPFLCP